MKLSKEVYNNIRRWVYMHACHLDVMRWKFHFENGSAEDVAEALLIYQNEDGGFGHGIGDFDNMSPLSTPTAICWGAYGILREIGYDKADNKIVQDIIRYFENCKYITDKGVYFSVPENSTYPCRPWFLFSDKLRFEGDWAPEININGDFAEIVLTHGNQKSELYKKAVNIVKYRISILPNLEKYLKYDTSIWQGIECHDFCKLIKLAKRESIISDEQYTVLSDKLLKIVKENGLPETYKSTAKLINGENETEEDIEKIISDLTYNKYWSENGLFCENPAEKLSELCDLGNPWWPIKDAIRSLIILKKHNRIM